MDKKGIFLLNNTVSISIAVLGLVLVGGFAAVVISNAFSSQESESAKSMLEILDNKIEALEEGESNSFPIRGVDDWYLVGWNVGDAGRPERCFDKSCICVCPDVSGDSCQSKGFCRYYGETRIEVFTNKFFAPEGEYFYQLGKRFSELSRDCIPLRSNLQEIFIRKNEVIEVSYNRDEADEYEAFLSCASRSDEKPFTSVEGNPEIS